MNENDIHRMRCETCTTDCNRRNIVGSIYYQTEICGCCSHSDMAHHNEQVRREERERVLDEIFNKLMEIRFSSDLTTSYLVWSGDMEEVIESLRQSSKKETD